MEQIRKLFEFEGLACASSQNVNSFIVGSLLDYREEGIELAPTILFCESVASIIQSFPGSVNQAVGETQLAPDTTKQVLKDCAPLTTSSWNIYIERSDAKTMRYGIFRYQHSPLRHKNRERSAT